MEDDNGKEAVAYAESRSTSKKGTWGSVPKSQFGGPLDQNNTTRTNDMGSSLNSAQ